MLHKKVPKVPDKILASWQESCWFSFSWVPAGTAGMGGAWVPGFHEEFSLLFWCWLGIGTSGSAPRLCANHPPVTTILAWKWSEFSEWLPLPLESSLILAEETIGLKFPFNSCLRLYLETLWLSPSIGPKEDGVRLWMTHHNPFPSWRPTKSKWERTYFIQSVLCLT